jgi:phospholipid transport system substrate-binding protein
MKTVITAACRAMLAIVLAMALAAPALAATGAGQDAMQSTRQLVDGALAILRNPALTLNDKRRQLRALAEGDFDFPDMARSAMGARWDTISAGQRAGYSRLFTAFIEDAYLNKIQDYSGQDIEFTGERMTGVDLAEVDTVVVKSGEEPIKLNFMLRRTGGGWRIYDLVIDDLSVIDSYRAQFAHLIDTQGFDQLMTVMRQKQERLDAQLGSK